MVWYDEIDLFWPLLLVSQLSGMGTMGIIIYWVIEYKQNPFKWGKDDCRGCSDWHAVMFTLGMVFLFGEAMLLFPVPKRLRLKSYFWRKVLHGCTQTAATAASIVGLLATLQYKDHHDHNEFYSVHAWLGIMAVGLFFLQLAIAMLFFILSKFFRPRFMIKFTSQHVFWGYALFALSIASCLTGMARWITVNVPHFDTYTTKWPSKPTVLGDAYAVLMVIFGIVVSYIATRPLPKKAVRKKAANAYVENGKVTNTKKDAQNGLKNQGYEVTNEQESRVI